MISTIEPQLRLSGIVLYLYESGMCLAGEDGRDVEAYFEAQRGKRAPWADVQMFATRIRRNIRLAEVAELRAIDFSVRARFARGGGLQAVGGGSREGRGARDDGRGDEE